MHALLLACAASGAATTTGTDTLQALGVANLEVSDCADDTALAEERLSLSNMGGGAVLVAHLGYRADCCLGFTVAAWARPEVGTVSVDYAPVGEPCDCQCSYDLGYRLEGVPDGDWTVDAAGTTADVRVQ